jgi:hypothetical protein
MKGTIILLFLFFGTIVFSQQKDFQWWNKLTIEKKISPRMRISLTDGLRFHENSTQFSKHFNQVNFSYRFTPKFSSTFSYRLVQKSDKKIGFSIRNRLQLDLAYNTSFRKFSFEFQERFQTQIADINRSVNWNIPTNYLRTRITVDYKLVSKFKPFVSSEIFYLIGYDFTNYRLRAGLNYKLNKKNSFSLFYMLDQEINVNKPISVYVLGTSYKFSF